jgi:hypothetical protein
MARSLNIVIGANIEKLRQGFNDAISVIKKAGGEMSADVAKSAKSIEEKLASIATRNPTMGTVRQLTQLAMEARALGPEFAASADQFIREAGRIKDSIGDARGEVAYFASDTRRLDAVLGGVQAVAGAFGAVQGAAALLGGENKELQQTLVKLQAAMAIVSGAQAIQNALQAESTVMVGLQTAATRVQTYVMGQATVAARVYTAALLATGAGVVIAALALVYSALQKNAEAAEEAEAAQKKYNDEVAAYNNRAYKFLERQLKFHEEAAIKRAQLAGKTEAQILQVEHNNLNKRLAAYKRFHDSLSDSSELKLELTQRIQETENAITLHGLDMQIAASKAAVKARKSDLKDEVTAEELAAVRIAYLRENAIPQKIQNNERQGIKTIDPAPIDIKAPQKLEHTFVKIDYAMQNQIAKQEEYEASFAKTMEGVNQAFNSLTAQGLEDFGNMIGDLMTGQISSFDDFGKSLLASVAKFMRAFGSALIATATASKAFKELLIKDPILAAAAGVALVAGSAVITGMLNKGPQPTAFADGGIVSGPTLGLVGEYPGASSNPEVIAPLDKLKGMLKGMGDEGGYVASTTISGRDLALVIERYNKDSKRG